MAARVCYPVRPFSFQRQAAKPAWHQQAKKWDASRQAGRPMRVLQWVGCLSDPRQNMLALYRSQGGHCGQRLDSIGEVQIGVEPTLDPGVGEPIAKLGHRDRASTFPIEPEPVEKLHCIGLGHSQLWCRIRRQRDPDPDVAAPSFLPDADPSTEVLRLFQNGDHVDVMIETFGHDGKGERADAGFEIEAGIAGDACDRQEHGEPQSERVFSEKIAKRSELVGGDDRCLGRKDAVAVLDAESDGHRDLLR